LKYNEAKIKIDRLFTGGADIGDVVVLAESWGLDGCHNAIMDYIQEAGAKPKTSIQDTLNDTGNAERLFKTYGENLRYIPELNRFTIWDGDFWKLDNPANTETIRLCINVSRVISHETGFGMSDKDFKDVLAWAKSSLSASRLNAMATLVRSLDGITVSLREFDKNPMLLNCQNGTLNLETIEFTPHKQSDMLLRVTSVVYNKAAECPIWIESFLNTIMESSADLIPYLQKIAGYSLTGLNKEQSFFYCYGVGRNGKSTLVNTIVGIMGDYAAQCESDLFMAKQFAPEGHNEALANLQGKRLIATTEVESGKRLAPALLKKITGGESIKTSRKYEHEIEFVPECKIWISGNHKLEIPDATLSIWRRVKMIPFSVIIPESQVNTELFNDLKTEWPGILNWMVEGCKQWQLHGLNDSIAVKRATGQYRDEQDMVTQFIEDKCVIGFEYSVAKSDLYKTFENWNEGQKIGRTDFGQRLRQFGTPGTIGESRSMSERLWTGIGLMTKL
jgi:putative DNA primase/helicase